MVLTPRRWRSTSTTISTSLTSRTQLDENRFIEEVKENDDHFTTQSNMMYNAQLGEMSEADVSTSTSEPPVKLKLSPSNICQKVYKKKTVEGDWNKSLMLQDKEEKLKMSSCPRRNLSMLSLLRLNLRERSLTKFARKLHLARSIK